MFEVKLSHSAQKSLKRVSRKDQSKLIKAMEELVKEPFSGKKLQGEWRGYYSLRVWPYRIVYQVWKKQVTVLVVHSGHRQGIYNH